MDRLPDEILLKVFQFTSLSQRIGVFPRVCKRWRRLCNDNVLWKVIEIPSRFGSNRLIAKILKRCAGPKTQVLRILLNQTGNSAASNALTKLTWELILSSCHKLRELYIENALLNNLANLTKLPQSIERIHVISCHHGGSEKTQLDFIKFFEGIHQTHPNLQIIDSGHSPSFYNRAIALNDKACTKVTMLGLSQHHRLVTEDLLRSVRPLKNLEVLDIRASCSPGGFNVSGIKMLLSSLINLKKLDLSDNLLYSNRDINRAWGGLWSPNVVMALETLKICLVKITDGIGNDSGGKHWFELDNPFRVEERMNLTVIGCRISDRRDHDCEISTLIPSPTTFIPV